MAANADRVEEKAAKELEEKMKTGKSREEIEKELDPHNIAYKIKDETGE